LTRDLVGILSKHNAGAVPRDRYQFVVLVKVDSPMEDSDDERTVAPIQVSRQFEDDMAAAVDGGMRRYDQEYLPGGAGEAGAQACVLLWGPRTSKQVRYSCTKGVDPKKLSAGGFADALQFALRTAEEMGEADDQDLDEVQSWMLDFVSEDIKRMLTTVAKEIWSIELHQEQNKCTSGSAAGMDTQKRRGDDDSMDDSDDDDALLHLDSGKERSTQCQGKDDPVEGKSVTQEVKQGERTSAGKKSSVEDDSDEAGKPSGKRRAVSASKPEAAVATKKGSALRIQRARESQPLLQNRRACKGRAGGGQGGR